MGNKHYTTTELTGLSIAETKEKNVLIELNNLIINNTSETKPWARRYELRLTIGKALSELLHKPIDKSTVYNFINYFLGMGYIEQNPDSHITVNNNILPDNMTKYFLIVEPMRQRIRELSDKEQQFKKLKGKNSLSPSLDSFSNEKSRSCPENQKENMGTTQD